jgi:transcriptional regulator with PAS, ATPase and Fis domain
MNNQSTSLAIITQNDEMRSILGRIEKISHSSSSILLIGETGVGKEVFAEYIHRTSERSGNPMVRIGLSSVPTELLASELFGFEKGSFTHAIHSKKGLFELAHTGTIFLDDIDDLPMDMQTKLLRVLESREVMKIGGSAPIPVDVRLVCASKVELKEQVKKGLFREDLFYRINVVPIHIPPLRERKDDISLLVDHFIKRFNHNGPLPVTERSMKAMIAYNWPGNIRELRNVIQRALLYAEKTITLEQLPKEISGFDSLHELIKACHFCFSEGEMTYNHVMQCVERNLLTKVLKKTEGNQSEAARILGLNLSTLRDKIKKMEQEKSPCPGD